MSDFSGIIQTCRNNFGEAPRRFSLLSRATLRQKPPLWLLKSRNDLLWEQFRFQDKLLSDGVVIWGHLVQANSLLFKPGLYDHPASLVISFDPEADYYPVRLDYLAHQIFSHKGTKPDDDEMAALSDPITDEMIRHSVEVSDRLVALKDCHMVSVMVARKHLPAARISGGLFPVLALPGQTTAVMILPCKFWDRRLLDLHRSK